MTTQPVILNPRSRNITEGKSRAPNRSMYYALGYETEDFNKPMIGVANGHSTITPCNSGLQNWPMRLWQALKKPVAKRKPSARPPSVTVSPWARRA